MGCLKGNLSCVLLFFFGFAGVVENVMADLYDEAATELYQHYKEEVARSGGQLQINFLRHNNSNNASATRDGSLWKINVGGGFLNNHLLSLPAFRLLLCHELGHHIGGEPYKFPESDEYGWIAVEGQSDYFATARCAPLFLKNREEQVAASLELAEYWWFRKRRQRGPRPSLDAHAKERPPRTLIGHPSPQCRLDTYLAGLDCSSGQDCRPPCWYVPEW